MPTMSIGNVGKSEKIFRTAKIPRNQTKNEWIKNAVNAVVIQSGRQIAARSAFVDSPGKKSNKNAAGPPTA